jgi:hypothetical protein
MSARAGSDETERDAPIRAVSVVERGFSATAHSQCQSGACSRRCAAFDELAAIDPVCHFGSSSLVCLRWFKTWRSSERRRRKLIDRSNPASQSQESEGSP